MKSSCSIAIFILAGPSLLSCVSAQHFHEQNNNHVRGRRELLKANDRELLSSLNSENTSTPVNLTEDQTATQGGNSIESKATQVTIHLPAMDKILAVAGFVFTRLIRRTFDFLDKLVTGKVSQSDDNYSNDDSNDDGLGKGPSKGSRAN